MWRDLIWSCEEERGTTTESRLELAVTDNHTR